jgi:hypothetical protein
MMSTRLLAGWAALALLLAGAPQIPVLAKPPALPIDPKVKLQETPPQPEVHSEPIQNDVELGTEFGRAVLLNEEHNGTLGFGISIDSTAGCIFAFNLAMGQPVEALSETEGVFAEVSSFLLACLNGNSGFMGIEINGALPVKPAAEARPNGDDHSTGLRCPYLQKQRTRSGRAATNEQPTTVLDNIQKLQKAQELYGLAEGERQKGHIKSACYLYEQIQRLCPGSRFDREARHRLAQAHAEPQHGAGESDTEEEEPDPLDLWIPGAQMTCKIRAGNFSLHATVQPNGRGSLMFGLGYEALACLPWSLWEQRDMFLKCFNLTDANP